MHRKQLGLTSGMLLGAAGLILCGLSGQPVSGGEKVSVILDPAWTIAIRSAQRESQPPGPAAEVDVKKPIGPELPPAPTPPAVAAPRMTYAQAYAAVPFSRTEYEANPVYRHQAALEVMFGVLRPMTLNQQYTPRAFRYPDFYQYPYAHSGTQNIDIHQWGGGYNYGGFNGQSPFGYPYGLRGNW